MGRVNSMDGIDVSMHNGAINFASVAATGIDVVIIKATEGVQYIDPMFEAHYEGASGTGLAIGFYHFMSEHTDPAQQAEDFWNAIKDKEYNVIPVLDIESNTVGRSQLGVTDRCIAFLEKFKELSGINCVIYSYVSFANDFLGSSLSEYPCWIAHYGVDTPGETSTWGSNYVGHQYSEKEHLSGIDGNCDMNTFTNGILLGELSSGPSVASTTVGGIDYNGWYARLQAECNAQGFSNQGVDNDPGKITLAGCPVLKEGAEGNITRLLQEKLGIKIDGAFGPKTKASVEEFQVQNGLTKDGVVGKNTWKALLGI